MKRIIIQGIHGKMGRALCERIANRQDCCVVAGIDLSPIEGEAIPVVNSPEKLPADGDVVIDFSAPEASLRLVDYCVDHSLPCVLCTTGFSAEQQEHIRQAAQKVAIFQSANMSLGINLLAELACRAAKKLGLDYDIEIIEKHHHNKVDAPSGTALLLADAINSSVQEPYTYVYDRHAVRKARDRHEMGLHSVRGGSIVGEHEVLFCGQDEVITLSHSAASRGVFANGAINAALFLCGKPAGLYTMHDLLEG